MAASSAAAGAGAREVDDGADRCGGDDVDGGGDGGAVAGVRVPDRAGDRDAGAGRGARAGGAGDR